ncbi:23S rRNA (cytidine(2498)-2'-O)-methyltransferase RlmM [Stutzerimonas urumqiensis]|uniref:23S rRNA (cytidine(2498)-2'-O)-methyltransferase RlmM n=1 Tax=Stutzerimonas urumqiensis TaxID=638269 RepID=UPI000EAEA977|nr:23S rRNA (cytidine(2498)-2'-O)-methyltransferase RlmM [Stutzerimonas urumqiensis]
MDTLLLHCRPGFENEVCAEINDLAAELGVSGYARAKPNSAYAQFVCGTPEEAWRLVRTLEFSRLIFIRQWAAGGFIALPEGDRLGAIEQSLDGAPVAGSLWLEVFDTNEGKALSTFCRKFEGPLRKALIRQGRLKEGTAGPRLLLSFVSGREVFVGLAPADNSALWPMGIPRLKFPREAPSRSTLKLEEAWHHFLPRAEWDARLAPGMTAVDLGASPGGWTWQLVNRHMKVSAVDNGPMNEQLMDSGLVDHVRADGFAFRPRRPVDWMVCDIVEKPARNAALMEAWIGEGLCREAVVNLKLPMKQRYAEVRRLLARVEEGLQARGLRVTLGCKQLYHDREEVTCHLRRL